MNRGSHYGCPVPSHRFGPDAARSWSDAGPPVWPRWVLLGLAVAGGVAGGMGMPEPACSALHPCTAIDIDSFGVFLALIALSVLGLWLWPTVGAVLGIAGVAVDLLYDPSVPARVLFTSYAAGCVHLLVTLGRSRRRQREIVADVPKEAVVATSSVIASGGKVWSVQLWVGAAAAVAVALLSFGSFGQDKALDEVHRGRAVKATGTVLAGWNDDGSQPVRLDQTGLPARVSVFSSSELPQGSAVRLLVDPTDPTWTELQDEPLDHSAWLALGLIGAGFALGAAGFAVVRARVAAAYPGEGVGLEVAVSSRGLARIRPLGGAGTLASFRTGEPTVDPGSANRRGRVDWTRAVVVGDLRDGGWVSVVTSAGRITPVTPIRSTRTREARSTTHPPGRMARLADRLPSRGTVAAVGIGLTLAGASAPMIPEAVVVAQGGGVAGTLTVTDKSCSKSCSYEGDFRSADGVFTFHGVSWDGTGEVGSAWPAVYVGSGERPDHIYEAGNSALLEDGFFTLLGLLIAGWPGLRALLERPPFATRQE